MATALKTKQESTSKHRKPEDTQDSKPKRLSKFALWRQENPNGILDYVDWRAVNR